MRPHANRSGVLNQGVSAKANVEEIRTAASAPPVIPREIVRLADGQTRHGVADRVELVRVDLLVLAAAIIAGQAVDPTGADLEPVWVVGRPTHETVGDNAPAAAHVRV